MKVVINKCYGGFSISGVCLKRMLELGYTGDYDAEDVESDDAYISSLERDNPYLVQAVEELGTKANGRYAELAVVGVPNDVKWYISDYDGIETIHEEHETWG